MNTFAKSLATVRSRLAVDDGSVEFGSGSKTVVTERTVTHKYPAHVTYTGRVETYVRPMLRESEEVFANPRAAMVRDMHRYAVPVPRKELY